MATTVTIDPITRIEGHLKSEVIVENGVVTGAKIAGTMARGIENLLLGKDPRDATYVTERICGVCFGSHGWASCLAVEKAHGTAQLPEAARLLRNLIVGACWLHDHPLHFYHLSALDYLDLRVLADYQASDPYILKLKNLALAELENPPVEGEYAGPVLPHYSYDDPYFIKNLDIVVVALQHYFEALNMQVKAKKMSALLAGKQPHQSGMIVGGVTQKPAYAIRETFRNMLSEQINFIENVYVNDVLMSGHHAQIAQWRRAGALMRTLIKRPDLLPKQALNNEEVQLLEKWRCEIERLIRGQGVRGPDSPSGDG